MQYTMINGTTLRVSRVGLGTWAIGGLLWGGSDEQEAIRTIHTALDTGVTLIDTAPVYGFGKSEEIVGRALSGYRQRDKVIIATKVGLEWRNDSTFRNSSRRRIFQEIEDSLRRLKTDYIDIYQVHWPDSIVRIEETAEAMAFLHQKAKIRAIGVSNYAPKQIDQFRAVAPLHLVQSPYNLFERDIERNVLSYARRTGLGVFVAKLSPPLIES